MKGNPNRDDELWLFYNRLSIRGFFSQARLQYLSSRTCGPGRPALWDGLRNCCRGAALSERHLLRNYRPAFHHRGSHDAGKRLLYALRWHVGRMDGPQAADEPLRPHLYRRDSYDRPFAWLCAVVLWPPAGGHQRRIDRRGDSAVSGRVSVGIRTRQGTRQFFSGCPLHQCSSRP